MQRLTAVLLWALRLTAFLLLFGLALKNSDTVELRFFLDHAWQGPLSVVVLASFGAGVALGLTAIAGRRRRSGETREN